MSKALKPRFSKGQLNEDIPNHIYSAGQTS